MYSAADSESMRPQDGCGSGMPSPRNDSADSTRSAEPTGGGASTISGASVFGSTWRSAMRVSLMPTARAASTNGISRSVSVFERMMRATFGTSGMATAIIVLGSEREDNKERRRGERGAERSRHHQRHGEERQGLQDVGQALNQKIEGPAEV